MAPTTNPVLTPAMKRRGCFLAAMAIVLILATWFSVTFVLAWQFNLRPALSAGIGVAVTLGAILLWMLGAGVRERSKRGDVVMDFGFLPDRRKHLIKGGCQGVACVGAGLAAAWYGNAFLAIAAPAFGVFQGLLNLHVANGRLQVLDNGLWSYGWLLPWEKLHAYRWSNESTLVILMPVNRTGSESEVPIFIAPEHQTTLDAILADRMAVRPVSTALSPMDAP